jgi:cytochrome c556
MKTKLALGGLTLLLSTSYSASALAQARPEVLLKQRVAVMTLQGKYFYGQLRPVAQGKAPYDANRVANAAELLAALNKMPWDGFDPRTKDLKSGALPVIYEQPAKFKESADRMQAESAKLVSISKSGDEAAVKAQILAVGKACDACHESFRERQ